MASRKEMDILPWEMLNVIGDKVGNVGSWRQTARGYTNVGGNVQFNLLNDQGDTKSVCFFGFSPETWNSLVKVQILMALRDKFLHMSLVSQKGVNRENCGATFKGMYSLLRHACNGLLVLGVEWRGPNPMDLESVSELFANILAPSNTIAVLQIATDSVAKVEHILRHYTTLETIGQLDVMLPDVFFNLRHGQTVDALDWYPNVLQFSVFNVLKSMEPSRSARLKLVRILRLDGSDVNMGELRYFEFGFTRVDGRITEYG